MYRSSFWFGSWNRFTLPSPFALQFQLKSKGEWRECAEAEWWSTFFLPPLTNSPFQLLIKKRRGTHTALSPAVGIEHSEDDTLNLIDRLWQRLTKEPPVPHFSFKHIYPMSFQYPIASDRLSYAQYQNKTAKETLDGKRMPLGKLMLHLTFIAKLYTKHLNGL